jgi:protein-tyrosine kinase
MSDGLSIPRLPRKPFEEQRKERELCASGLVPVSEIPVDESMCPAELSHHAASPLPLDHVHVISAQPESEGHLVALNASVETSLGNEKFLILRHRLAVIRQRRPLKTLVVTGSMPGEGKTMVALNLALSLARSYARVLLVDADMRKPAVRDELGLPFLSGLCEHLEGRWDLASSIRQIGSVGLYLLTAGRPTHSPVGLLQGPRMQELVATTRATFDWVIYDTPPVNPFADAQCLAAMTDGVLMVTRAGMTPRGCLQQALRALDGCYITGIVLNGSRDPHADDYYGYYYSQRKARTGAAGVPPVALAAKEIRRG